MLEPDEWQYEPQAYASEQGQYLPDFWWPRMNAFVEVKPTSLSWNELTGVAEQMQIIWSSELQANLMLCTYRYGGQTPLVLEALGSNRIWQFWMPGMDQWGIWPLTKYLERLATAPPWLPMSLRPALER